MPAGDPVSVLSHGLFVTAQESSGPSGCAPLASVRSEWRFWPEREDVTLRKQTAVGTYTDHELTATCGAVKRRAITFKEMAASAGAYTNQDQAFLIPAENLPFGVVPAPGDILLDDDAISWTIGDVTVGKFRETHKCVARALAIVNALSASGQLKRAPYVADSAGRPAGASYANVGSAVACRVQPEDSAAGELLGRVTIPRRYTAFLATPLTVQAHDQFVVSGASYTVLGFKNVERVWDLMSLDLELIG